MLDQYLFYEGTKASHLITVWNNKAAGIISVGSLLHYGPGQNIPKNPYLLWGKTKIMLPFLLVEEMDANGASLVVAPLIIWLPIYTS